MTNNINTTANETPALSWQMPAGLAAYREYVKVGDYNLSRLMEAPLQDMAQPEREAALMVRAQVQLLLRLSHKNLLR